MDGFFFYNSKEFLIDKDPAYQLSGNSPLIVDKYSGKIFITGTAHSIEYYIERYKRDNNSLTEVDIN
ncbi:YrhB domain-containing protein [Chryseolinea serpens]|uniref:YrhB domain-containing protein n=1 Tax=Chryseolinea serpens TaxID=947013 RepID=UPI00373FE122